MPTQPEPTGLAARLRRPGVFVISPMVIRAIQGAAAMASLAAVACGCASEPRPIDPQFPLTQRQARAALKAMRENPRPLQRPLVILGGWNDPGIAGATLRSRVEELTARDPGAPIIELTFAFNRTFDDCRAKVIDALEKQYPCDDPLWTTQVDVIGVSMGGLIARHAAAPAPDAEPRAKRLRIARLFTLASPHQGANWARLGVGGSLEQDMRPGSPFLARLDAHRLDSGFQLLCYARTRDAIVGLSRTAPPGQAPWRVETPTLEAGHVTIFSDERILADIARRLRQEEPFTREPPTPLGPEPEADKDVPSGPRA